VSNTPIVLIHGLWMTPLSWENWIDRYEQKGHLVIAPSWPGLEGGVEQIRRAGSSMADVGIKEIVDHHSRIISELEQPPIIMGHSFGGAFTQILVDRGFGAAGVAIDSAAVKGVLTLPPSTLRAGWPALKNPANRKKLVPLSLKQFRYRFTNVLNDQQTKAAYDRYYVPGPGRILFQAATANFNPKAGTKVNFRNAQRAPLLFIAGEKDHVSPPGLNKANFKHYRKSKAITEYKEFPGRSHFIVGQDGWQEVADYALTWALANSGPNAASQRVAARAARPRYEER
jgi:pimeloyl-ACP methyl ester carboxylesterase